LDHALRRSRLARRLAELDLDVLVVTRLPNVRYLTGFTGSNAQVVLARDGDSTFLTDGRYGEQARHEVPDVGHSVYTAGYPRPLIEAWRSLGATRVGFERKGLTYEQWEQLTEVAEGAELVPVGAEVEALRITKDPEEITLIAAAQEAADVAFERVILRGGLREGRTTEREVARALDAAMLDAGADERGFETIVAFGPSAAEPHHDPTDRPLSRGDVVKLDFGGLMGGYHSDMTRTVAFGEPDVRLREIHDLVADGTDAVIGFVETHGRDDTARLLKGLEVVPRRRVEHRGVAFEEMDPKAILARAPEVALIDELAHANVPGSGHPKRWQDVEDILEAGIDVISSVNIQHFESLNDVVEEITGVSQREVIPDEVVRKADEIHLVDPFCRP